MSIFVVFATLGDFLRDNCCLVVVLLESRDNETLCMDMFDPNLPIQ